jgi:putative hydrolase of the HAD superfamily
MMLFSPQPPTIAGLATDPPPSLTGRDIWVFDLDDTLYPAQTGLFAAMQARMSEYIAARLSLPLQAAHFVRHLYYTHYRTSLAGLMQHHNVDPEEYLAFVQDKLPLENLRGLPPLQGLLRHLPGNKFLYTNAGEKFARLVLKTLEIEALFSGIFDIKAANWSPKPAFSSYCDFLALYNINPNRAVMIDDLAANLAPAFQLGFYTVWLTPNPPPLALPPYVCCTTSNLYEWLLSLISLEGARHHNE